jgi:hypothetical protein
VAATRFQKTAPGKKLANATLGAYLGWVTDSDRFRGAGLSKWAGDICAKTVE